MNVKYDLVMKKNKGQSTVEFTFAFLITIVLIFAMVRVFAWVGKDLSGRVRGHESVLQEASGSESGAGPLTMTRPIFYTTADVGATWDGNIFK